MQIFENIQLALTSLVANKMRSILTMLGIIIGIGSVIAIVTIGDSMTGAMNAEMAGFGARNVTINVQPKDNMAEITDEDGNIDWDRYEQKTATSDDYLTDAMLKDYEARFKDVLDVLSINETVGSGKATNGRLHASVNVSGCSPDRQKLDGLTMLAGRYIERQDVDAIRSVAVVSSEFVTKCFGNKTKNDDVLGKAFTVPVNGKDLRFYIIGVYKYVKPDSQFMMGGDTETTVYVPYTSAKRLMQLPAGYSNVTVRSKKEADSSEFLTNTSAYFASYYTHNKDFTAAANSMENMMKSMNKMLGSVKLGISAVAAISLLVGGIGVMNIMMVSVTERTREIGIRMALGAKSRVILLQFIVEAIIICLIGGLIGVGIGVALGSIGAQMLKYAARPSVIAILVAVSFSMAIGVFFGYYPASKASKLDPIEALRYE